METIEQRNSRLRMFARRIRKEPYGLKNNDITDLIESPDQSRGSRWMSKYNITRPELDIIENYFNANVGMHLSDWDIDRIIKNFAKQLAINRKANYNIACARARPLLKMPFVSAFQT